ncbi:hypothetical protein EIL87_01705 [Saccharopolyspora rhizosphaerae]|uniref:Putative host cell surface-exposed lipoprotein Ltp-like HTH region domain-containing protein n=1 Tax=Saccharopolyspora rhizosphaerae TaxID=2492662 RepID=A0A3R8P5J8_9PSEU|nr:Ltp family lipoprotein [Saccharopolyspora rhizosphaerae]RRO20615.1 hypothetical protein EIL87_01705 [Saccharopolyspora rhizosphaerae]
MNSWLVRHDITSAASLVFRADAPWSEYDPADERARSGGTMSEQVVYQQGFGRAALTLGCIGLPLAFVPVLGFLALPVVVVGVTLGFLGVKRVKRGLATNERAAWAGTALCLFGLVVCLTGGPAESGPVQQQATSSGGFVVSEPQYPSREHENAVESAESYVRSGDFSRAGLVDQLAYEQYPSEVCEWAVAHVQVDWNAEALGSAESYLRSGSFSDAELRDQLAFEHFAPEQVDYAMTHLR